MVVEGAIISTRCPKCGSADFVIYEQFNVYDALSVVDGKVTDIDACVRPQATGRLDIECHKCAHSWRSRRNIHTIGTNPPAAGEGE